MEALRHWSFARVLLVSVSWVLLCLLLAVAWLLVQLRGAVSSGSGGIGVVSGGFSELVFAIPLAPPILLLVAWIVARWR